VNREGGLRCCYVVTARREDTLKKGEGRLCLLEEDCENLRGDWWRGRELKYSVEGW
jgi:hypothetical protein